MPYFKTKNIHGKLISTLIVTIAGYKAFKSVTWNFFNTWIHPENRTAPHCIWEEIHSLEIYIDNHIK